MFEGFSQEALDFLNDIRFNNNQTFYEANKARYERYVKQPMRELSDELAPSCSSSIPSWTRDRDARCRAFAETRAIRRINPRFGITHGWAGAIRVKGAARVSTCIGALGRTGSAGAAAVITRISR